MSDPFKDALRETCRDCGESLAYHDHDGCKHPQSSTPETDSLDWSCAVVDTLEQRRTQMARNKEKMESIERQRNDARIEAANWKQLYTEAVERSSLFQSQRDETREEIDRLRAECERLMQRRGASAGARGKHELRKELK